MLDKPTIARVKAQADIVEVIGSVVTLTSSGGGFKGLCPFHAEKTPSFTVSPAKSMYHCFGCGQGGSVIDFVMANQGLNFVEATTHLAQRYGVALPKEQGQASPFWQASKALEMALEYYQRQLLDNGTGKRAQHYLEERGFSQTDWQTFQLGYAPDGWDALLNVAQRQQISQKALIAAGLARINQRGSAYDFLRQRVIFPIFSHLKHPIAFAGRTLTSTDQAKYINTPDTQHYHKSEVLFGLPQAVQALQQSKQVLIVEGYLDVMRMHQHGFHNALATCGTALTPQHITLLKRWVNQVVLVFDGDAAGVKAALHCGGFLLDAGLSAKVAILPKGQDPDDFLREHPPSQMHDLLGQAQPLLEWTLITLLQQHGNSLEGKQHTWQALLPMLQRVKNIVARDGAIQHAAEVLALSKEALLEQLAKTPKPTLRQPAPRPAAPNLTQGAAEQSNHPQPNQPPPATHQPHPATNQPAPTRPTLWQVKSQAEGTLLCLLLHWRDLLPFAAQHLQPQVLLYQPYQALYRQILKIEDADFAEMDEETLLAQLGSVANTARALLMDWRIASGAQHVTQPKEAFKHTLYRVQKNARVASIRQAKRQNLEQDEKALNAYLHKQRNAWQKSQTLRQPTP